MKSLVFENQLPIAPSDPNRADIACFVGFVRRRATLLPTSLRDWLQQRGWIDSPYDRPNPEQLLDLPVPIDSWELFDRLFAWDDRPLDGSLTGATYLGAAVRSFFAQGGRRCYVVRVGNPWQFTAGRSQRLSQIDPLIPGYPLAVDASPADQSSWQGVGHLLGLPDVSFLCLPDLADAIAAERQPFSPPILPPPPTEQFVECSDPLPVLTERAARLFQAPRADLQGYDAWATAIWAIANWLSRYRREVQLVAAIPLPMPNSDAVEAERDLLRFLTRTGEEFTPPGASEVQPFVPPLATHLIKSKGIASAFVQLAYPWVETPGAIDLPEQLESPDAVLTGILARNSLQRGAFRSATRSHPGDVQRLYPTLTAEQLEREHHYDVEDPAGVTEKQHTLPQRVSLFGETPNGLRLLSDVTTSFNEGYRAASVNRLVMVILRAARRLGEEIVFEASGEALWKRLRDSMTGLMASLLQVGALRDTAAEPFRVICDRRTMTQADIDNGRVIAQIEFEAAVPIERITVVLAMSEGGQVALLNSPLLMPEAA